VRRVFGGTETRKDHDSTTRSLKRPRFEKVRDETATNYIYESLRRWSYHWRDGFISLLLEFSMILHQL
jgi:cyclopropane fatty-acyl-phospholipid synthase-like methyltransferase